MFFTLFPRLEHPAGWVCARYKLLLLLLLLLLERIFSANGSGLKYVHIWYVTQTCVCLHLYKISQKVIHGFG